MKLQLLFWRLIVESNDTFGDYTTLESSNSSDSEKDLCFSGMEVDETEENDQQLCLKNCFFFFFWYIKSFDVSSLFPVEKVVAIIVQF